ncbi:hypothetical protein A3D00_03415 [Candidatus Woesebacteria bacterium RIFCSPHIGHO2_02_FULL_38_9]|nr:MAG: hypothetical protein A3D00_03415 [Candidatus Woesebacteria bacterium RIFCSPHIGHO2_02_FULL_38_9]
MKIIVLYNLPENLNDESDVDTQTSAHEISEILKSLNHQVNLLGIDKKSINYLKKLKTDLVFNLTEWSGKDYIYSVEVLNILQTAKIPFTGSDAKGILVSDNKILMKRKMDEYKIPTAKWTVFNKSSDETDPGLNFPLIVKPAYEHCGIGITQESVVRNVNELKKQVNSLLEMFNEPIIAEEFIDGRELHITILEKDGHPWMLPPAEVFYQPGNYWKILTYKAKWSDKSWWEYDLSEMGEAKLQQKTLDQLEKISVVCYEKLGGKDYPRLDIRLRGEEVYVLEINNNPGIDSDSQCGITVSSKLVNFEFPTLVNHVVKTALTRFNNKRWETPKIGSEELLLYALR